MRVTLGGAEIDLLVLEEVEQRVFERLQGDAEQPLFIASANLDHLHHFGLDSGREGSFDHGRGGADWLVLVDGMPLVWYARHLTGRRWPQLAGSEILPNLLRTAARAGARVGFLGGSEEQHRALVPVLAEQFDDVEIAGYWCPERDELREPDACRALAESIRAADVGLLIVGLPKPLQEEWMTAYGRDTSVDVAVGFGAAADFLAGMAKRAPARISALGLEWLYRLLHEPFRLARRYLIQGPPSLYRLLRASRIGDTEGDVADTRVFASPATWRRRVGRVLALIDVAAVLMASVGAYVIRDLLGTAGLAQGFTASIPVTLALIPLWLMVFYGVGAYRAEYLNSGADAVRRFLSGAFGGLLAVGFTSFALNLDLSRGYVSILFALLVLFGAAARVTTRRYLRRQREQGRFQQNVVIVGADSEAIATARALANDVLSGYRPVGFLSDDLPIGAVVFDDLTIIGRPEDVVDIAYDQRAGLCIVSPSGVAPGVLRDVTLALEGSAVDMAVAPSLFEVVSRRVVIESVTNLPLLHVAQVRLERGAAATKRLVDVVVGLLLGLTSLPIVVIAMIAIRTDGGPALFRQERVGRDGRVFTLYKFRTMVVDADEQVDEIAHLNEAGHVFFKVRQDPRITPVGRFLRKWSIDELPQLANVLRGEMSMVGPRPALPREVEEYEPWQLRRLRVKPGITGIWQVSGRSGVPFEEAVRLDLFYIENWSLGYDLFLLGKTVGAVLGHRGAY